MSRTDAQNGVDITFNVAGYSKIVSNKVVPVMVIVECLHGDLIRISFNGNKSASQRVLLLSLSKHTSLCAIEAYVKLQRYCIGLFIFSGIFLVQSLEYGDRDLYLACLHPFATFRDF
jgi:hypothetical protein